MSPERTCGTCKHSHLLPLVVVGPNRLCCAPKPMWADDGDQATVEEDTDATHCAAYEEARDA